MGDSLLVRLRETFQKKQEDGWWQRVQENAHAFFALRGVKPSLAGNAGAFDLLDAGPAPGTRQRQAVSILVHALAIGVLVLLSGRVFVTPPYRQSREIEPLLSPHLKSILFGETPSGRGKGGNHDVLPPSSGQLPPRSPIVLVRPHIPEQREVELPVEPTIFDPNSQITNRHVRDLGLPWMKERNLSNGPGGGNTIGDKDGTTVGTSDRDGEGGQSDYDGPYSPGMTPVKCLYCPDPEYTDEARHEKLQGSVTLRVLVTKDGRPGQIKIVKGIGLGLDERSIAAVRSWKFQPARDANKNPISQWVTVETTYRLF